MVDMINMPYFEGRGRLGVVGGLAMNIDLFFGWQNTWDGEKPS